MLSLRNMRETSKVPARATRIRLSGSTLELSRDNDGLSTVQKLDLSRFDMYLLGVDTEGYLLFEMVPRSALPRADYNNQADPTLSSNGNAKVAFDPSRRRIHGDVEIPVDFVLFLERQSSQGSRYRVFVNEKKQFLLKVDTKDSARLHNLGEINNKKSFLFKLNSLFQESNRWLATSEIKDILHNRRFYDGQKMNVGLEILVREGLIKRQDGNYAAMKVQEEPDDIK